MPRSLTVENADATSIRVHWEAPYLVTSSSISYYLIIAYNLNSSDGIATEANTTTNATIFTISGLIPGTTYELILVAVSQGGDVIAKSEPSESVIVETAMLTGKLSLSIKFILL